VINLVINIVINRVINIDKPYKYCLLFDVKLKPFFINIITSTPKAQHEIKSNKANAKVTKQTQKP